VTFLRLDRDRRQSQLVAEPARRNKRCPLWQCAYLYAQQPNAINLHQLDLHAIRLPDTCQTDHIDWGFRVDTLYGMDYRFPPMKRHFHRAPP
jgi:hypothetical protein